MQVRQPAVAGQFYSSTEWSLRKEIEKTVVQVEEKIKAIGVVSPHAGYLYSGPVAGMLFSSVEVPETVVILGPNHTGVGKPYAITAGGRWALPMGEVEVAEDLAKDILAASGLVEEDADAHRYEHSLEVQVPFLQYFQSKLKIVPVVISGYDIGEFTEVGQALAKCIKRYGKDVLIVASSDMTHYEKDEEARRKDNLAIEAILSLDESEMLARVERHNISMCGYAPGAIMLVAAKALGAKEARLIRYITSGDTTGDYHAVVGYAGVAVW